MKKLLLIAFLIRAFHFQAQEHNLAIFMDNLHQETVKTDEINITHQLITALQQKVPMVLASSSLYKNIHDRKELFAKNMHKSNSIQASMLDFFTTTNQKIIENYTDIAQVNQLCGQSWYEQQYPDLACLEQKMIDQLKFNFLCYIFELDYAQYRCYQLPFGMILFAAYDVEVPLNFDEYVVDSLKISDKKSDLAKTLELVMRENKDKWVIYLAGHGHPESSSQGANIAGLQLNEFENLLLFCNENLDLELFVYASCYGGGVHTVEPYKDIALRYPVIVIALTDAPIFGFGLFEGFKLPPYDTTFYLEKADYAEHGLLPHAMQNYPDFFKRARRGVIDMDLVQTLSQFFICDLKACQMQKVENLPLFRPAGQRYFSLLSQKKLLEFVIPVSVDQPVTITKPMLLYTKKIEKITLETLAPVISMIPGLVSHEIAVCDANLYRLSEIIPTLFLAFPDSEHYTHFKIKKLICNNDMIGSQGQVTLTNLLILQQKKLRPGFINQSVQLAVYWKHKGVGYLILYDQGKVIEQRMVTEQEFEAMQSMYHFVQKSIDYGLLDTPETLLTYKRYLKNNAFHAALLDECVQAQVCKK